jgi:prepilin signal peptidase PulO-like enzyme (type II secretory pathway)
MVVAEATRIVEVGLFMFLFLFSSAFGLHWRENVFGIALGLGVFAAVDLINVTMRSQFGSGVAEVMNLVRMTAFNLSLLLWTVYLLAPERATSSAEIPKRAQLEQWNEAVMELISK